MFFIFPHQVPVGRKITYANFVCTIQPGKAESLCVRMTVGGDHLDAFQDVRSPAVRVTGTKLHVNRVISDAKHRACYCTANLKDFFLGSTMTVFQYMRLHWKYAKAHFNLRDFCYVKIRKGVFQLKEAAILAYKQLCDHLVQCRYSIVPNTPGLWHHATQRNATHHTTFTLAVDNFGINADQLLNAIATKYAMTTDWSRTSYLGFTINWNYNDGWIDISMPGYLHKALLTLKHPDPSKPQHALHCWTAPAYGQKVQIFQEQSNAPTRQAGDQARATYLWTIPLLLLKL